MGPGERLAGPEGKGYLRGNIDGKEGAVAIVLSYRLHRNPERLLESCGLGTRARNGREEERFLEALAGMPDGRLGDLCVIMGGFMDGMLGRAYGIRGELPPVLSRGFDVYYREHDEAAGVRRLLRRYGAMRRRIVLIGHSWGGSSLALDVLDRPGAREFPVTALITLDPVAVRLPHFLPQVRRWLNVYIPYGRAPWSRENNIARLGRPWEFVREAGVNRVFSRMRHADAAGMFREYGATFAELALLEQASGH